MRKRFSGLLIGLLSLVPALVKVHAAPGSPTIISAFPNATAAADNNQDAPGAPVGRVFKYFMQIWLENEVRSVSGFRFPPHFLTNNTQDYSTVSVLSTYQSVAAQGILLTNYNAITHPSEPNYVAAVAGTNYGITNDDYYDIPANQKSVFDLLEARGLTWKAYNEDIPAAGWTGYTADGGAYVRKHNPAIIFDNIGLNQTRSANVVSGGQMTTTMPDLIIIMRVTRCSDPPHERYRQ